MDEMSSEENLPGEVARSVFIQDVEGLLTKASNSQDVRPDFKYYPCDCTRSLVALFNPCTLHFYGSFMARCLAGKVEVFGRIIDPSKPPVNIFSHEGFSALYMATVEAGSDEVEVNVSTISNYGVPFMEATKLGNLVRSGGCILLLEELASTIFQLKVDTPLSRLSNRVEIHPNLRMDLAQGITVICGGQGVGKSTSLRYLCNRALNKVGRVLYLDLDPGQPEFTLHECVSATLIEDPLLGPSYTHFSRPVFSFNVGNIDVSRCVETYLRAVELLVNNCRAEYSDIPWIVNTMGFSRGVGVFITCSCLATLSPTLVIQLNGAYQNFPADLCPKYVEEKSNRPVTSFEFIKVLTKSRTTKKTRHIYSNKEVRHISTQHYFNHESRPSYPLIIPNQCIKVFNVINRTVISETSYADLVGKIVTLSSSNSIDEPPQVLDFGVILDYVVCTESLVVLTPLEESRVIWSLGSILVGSLQFPSRLTDAVDPFTSGPVPFCQMYASGSKASTPALKNRKRTFRFLFDTSVKASKQLEPSSF